MEDSKRQKEERQQGGCKGERQEVSIEAIVDMQYRNEVKHQINYADLIALRQRLKAVMKPDKHALDGKYEIHSLYFDTPSDKALHEKLDGVNKREKFRIRYYNNNTDLIHLEKKEKINSLCRKQSEPLSIEDVKEIINGSLNNLVHSNLEHSMMRQNLGSLRAELYSKMLAQQLKPKVIVRYTREPYVFAPGNVRVTLDYNIRTSRSIKDFLQSDYLNLPTDESFVILEVKWDEYIPDIIKDVIQLQGRQSTAFSKYAQCRIYG